jgi:uncharacterized protein (TIGR03435 family)
MKATLRNGRKTGRSEGKIAWGFWPATKSSTARSSCSRIRAGGLAVSPFQLAPDVHPALGSTWTNVESVKPKSQSLKKTMRAVNFAVTLLGITAISAQAQPGPVFEVASVKAASPRAGTEGLIATDTDPAIVRYSNITLKGLIALAYRFDSRLILGGPAWLDDQLYDLAAKLPPGARNDSVPVMLQTLLAERFKLAVHRETKEQRVYFLVRGKSGPRLKEALPEDDQGAQQLRGDRPPVQFVQGGIIGHSMQLGTLASVLALAAGYQVVDHTGLTGIFDINLKWTPEDSTGIGPDLFTAIQEQLGLKLESGKAPVEMLMIDHTERIPSEN